MRDMNSTSRGEYQTNVTHYHAQLGPPDKDRAIKGLVFCYVIWLRFMIYGMDPCCGQDGFRAQLPQQTLSEISKVV